MSDSPRHLIQDTDKLIKEHEERKRVKLEEIEGRNSLIYTRDRLTQTEKDRAWLITEVKLLQAEVEEYRADQLDTMLNGDMYDEV